MTATLNPLISAGAYLVTRVEVDSLEHSLDGLFIGTVEEFSNRWAGSAVQDKEDNWHIVPTGDNVQDAGTGRRVKMYSGGAFGRAKFHTRGWFEENAVKIFFGALTLPRGSGSKAAHSVSGEATTIEPVAQVIGHHKEEVGPGGRRKLGRSHRLGTALWLAAHNDTVEDRGAFVGGRPLLPTRSQARAAWDAGIGRRSELEHVCRLRCAHGRPNGCIAAAVPHWELIVAVWEKGARRNAARRARGQARVAYKHNHRRVGRQASRGAAASEDEKRRLPRNVPRKATRRIYFPS